jgi:hypothetical protein
MPRVSAEEQGTDPQRHELHAAGCDAILEEHAPGADRTRPVLGVATMVGIARRKPVLRVQPYTRVSLQA